jgi:PRTRC genetic system ThiF family protein
MTTITAAAQPAAGKHTLNARLAMRREGSRLAPTRIALVGAGGNGSQMVTCLARMDRALRSLGLPALHVTVYDPDRVSQSNVGRQLFYPDDVGQSKAICLVHRANLGFGLAWEAMPSRYAPNQAANYGAVDADILITCVDTGAARREIWETLAVRADVPVYWLDMGNEDETGQVWLGEFPRFCDDLGEDTDAEGRLRLPCITETFPSFFDGSEPETDAPTCSLAEALRSQDLFINDHVARWAAHLLWTLLRFGEIRHHGYWINLRDGTVLPVQVPAAKNREVALLIEPGWN